MSSKSVIVLLGTAVIAALVAIVVLSVMVAARAPSQEGTATANDMHQEPPIVDVEGLKQRVTAMDVLVQYFAALSSGDHATVYSMSCGFVQEGYDADRRAGLIKTVDVMTKERGRAHVQIPTSIRQITDTVTNVETSMFYEHPVATLGGRSFDNVRADIEKQDGAWKVCSVVST